MSGDLHVLLAICPTTLVVLLIQQLLQLVNGVDEKMELPLAQLQLQGGGTERTSKEQHSYTPRYMPTATLLQQHTPCQ